MPNRLIKESICTSPTIAKLSVEAERFFYRLIVKCDDYGRFHGDEGILLGACFPLLIEKITPADVRRWLAEIEGAGLIVRYAEGDRWYVSFTSWDKHQNIRAKESRYPAPTAENILPPLAGDRICNQMQADAPDTRISILGSRNSDTRSSSSADADGERGRQARNNYPADFERFWMAYPQHRRVAKRAAYTQWKRLGSNRPPIEDILKALAVQCRSKAWTEEGGRFVPHPERWLRHQRWEDDPAASRLEGGQGQESRSKPWRAYERPADEFARALEAKAARDAALTAEEIRRSQEEG